MSAAEKEHALSPVQLVETPIEAKSVVCFFDGGSNISIVREQWEKRVSLQGRPTTRVRQISGIRNIIWFIFSPVFGPGILPHKPNTGFVVQCRLQCIDLSPVCLCRLRCASHSRPLSAATCACSQFL